MVKWINQFFLMSFLLLSLQANGKQADKKTQSIYVSSISWHTGIVVPASGLPDSIWPEGHRYEDAAYLEIGWGEVDFYPSEGFNLWYALKSVFWPTSSVLHVNPIYRSVEEFYTNTDVVKIELTEEQLRAICRYLMEEFERDEKGKIIPAAEGIYPTSQFYRGSSSYYFPKNSNVWAARAIQRAGFSLRPIWLQTTGCVLKKVENFGELVVEKD
jgi:uncharacterized protein (TIGR02117 family)